MSGRIAWLRGILIFLTVVQGLLGAATLLWPCGFYDYVPTVNLAPPYSEHLFRDFGATMLGLAKVLGMAARFMEYRLVCAARGLLSMAPRPTRQRRRPQD